MEQLPMLPLIVPNTPIPPRSRACCFADSPRRGEYGALGRRLRRGQQCYFDVIKNLFINAEIAFIMKNIDLRLILRCNSKFIQRWNVNLLRSEGNGEIKWAQ
jgi:hypothetical protein